jgi:type IV pilus biogenesis protein CpaD/CtpE
MAMIPMRRAALALILGGAAGCAAPPTGGAAPEITFTPAAVVNPGAGRSVTVSAAVRGTGAGARLRWTSLAVAVVAVEPAEDGHAAVLRFAAQRGAAVVLAVLTPAGAVAAADTLPIGSISALAPAAAARP